MLTSHSTACLPPTALHGQETASGSSCSIITALRKVVAGCCSARPCVGGLENAVGQVLEAVVQLGGEGVDGVVDQGVEVCLKLLLGHVDMEATL